MEGPASLVIPPVPGKNIRYGLSDEAWTTALDLWCTSTSLAIAIVDTKTAAVDAHLVKIDSSLFLPSYLTACCEESADEFTDTSRRLSHSAKLAKNVFALVTKLYTETPIQDTPRLSAILAFADLYRTRNKIATCTLINKVSEAAGDAWDDDVEDLVITINESLHSAITNATSSSMTECSRMLKKIRRACDGTALAKTIARPKVAKALVQSYGSLYTLSKSIRELALVLVCHPDVSLKFVDSLLGTMDNNLLLTDMLARTNLLDRFATTSKGRPELNEVLEQLEAIPIPGRKHDALAGVYDETQDPEFQAKVDQIKDLFPDLENDYISACLKRYGQDLDTTTMHLLDGDVALNDVPLHDNDSEPPRLPERRNVFDGDAFDRLEIDTSAIRQGKTVADSDSLIQHGITDEVKSRVLILAMNNDEDEPDDTYDDLDGPKSGLPGNETDEASDAIDLVLYQAFEADTGVFDQSSRKTSARADLRTQTGLTDEQIEGWKSMLLRDPRRRMKIASKQDQAFRGNEKTISKSKWSRPDGDADDQSAEANKPDGPRLMEPSRTRHNPRGRRGRGRGASSGRGSRGAARKPASKI